MYTDINLLYINQPLHVASAVVETVKCQTSFPLCLILRSWPRFPEDIQSFLGSVQCYENGTAVEKNREEA